MDIIEDIPQSAIDAMPYDTFTEMAHRDFDGDIVITDPCYLKEGLPERPIRWWEFADKVIGDGGLMSRTFYGDWGCTVYEKDTGILGDRGTKTIGKFCADAGMVCVVHLKDVLKHNPKFEDEFIKTHDWCVAVIRGFKGFISFYCKKTKMGKYENVELRILGNGEKDGKPFYFETAQTSL